ncbi:MAG: hypothetical protein JRI23_04005 [Deltaproteobacteria bacterium]|nr:hypothetical protein [Deltaproteobacteria bacterium]
MRRSVLRWGWIILGVSVIGCAEPKPATSDSRDAVAALVTRSNELRAQCAEAAAGLACWELSVFNSRHGRDGEAMLYARKACLLGVPEACQEVELRSGQPREQLLARQMLEEMPRGLSPPERCDYWQRKERETVGASEELRVWVAHRAARTCPSSQDEPDSREAMVVDEEVERAEAHLELDRQRERRKPCILRCINARSAHLRACRSSGEFSAGPCHDRCTAATQRCLAVCETIQ